MTATGAWGHNHCSRLRVADGGKEYELSYFEGLTCAEMAARCEIPIGTVKSRLSAAMGKLRKSLAAAAGGP